MSARARTKKKTVPSRIALSSKGVNHNLSFSGSEPIFSATSTRKSLLKIVIFAATA